MKYQAQWQQSLINLAVGDALGYPLEFMKATPRDLQKARNQSKLVISDDTQMTLFTCFSIINNQPPSFAYLDWYETQIGGHPRTALGCQPMMQESRVPGTTTMSALSNLKHGQSLVPPRTYPRPETTGDGCGGLMRIAPYAYRYDLDPAIKLALQASQVTHHGDKSNAAVIAYTTLLWSLLRGIPDCGTMMHASVVHHVGPGKYEIFKRFWQRSLRAKSIEEIGAGFYADECLAMGLFAAINCERNFDLGIQLATCHGGDSDSVGAVAGTIMGAMGIAAPPEYFAKVVEAPIIRQFFNLVPHESRKRAEVG